MRATMLGARCMRLYRAGSLLVRNSGGTEGVRSSMSRSGLLQYVNAVHVGVARQERRSFADAFGSAARTSMVRTEAVQAKNVPVSPALVSRSGMDHILLSVQGGMLIDDC
ncbi:hypothetical protein FVE85_2212 [Porphyridium purpureum]|uniref:Uncharacterized protein n=1 Tax=Porphyridium purpureum TaxID=35688 RepID=A0A5J4Z032_PORPP|nr:hypothetical protein FVE85_2212 [Porphyridium purpureum]|eukprot:POR5497..scf209_3